MKNSRRDFIKKSSVAGATAYAGAIGSLAFTAKNGADTAHPVVHFEVGCKDLAATTKFYSETFGWSPTPSTMSANLNTNSKDGIQGHITALGHEPNNYVTFYIQVDDIKGMLTKIEAAGGKKVIGPFPLPNGKEFAWFRDNEGSLIGLVSA
jgi:predicted enzyme related to lactoylglutathione lyase